MTSGTFTSIPVSSIQVDRETRQRRDLPQIPELAESIGRLGLINPITVTRDHMLIAGERRFEAVKSLGWTHIPVQYIDELDPHGLRAIELEENIKRVDISWQDRTRAIQEYHELRKSEEDKWTLGDTAEAIGLDIANVSRHIAVAKEIATNTKVAEAPKFSVALGIVQRAAERRDEQTLSQIKLLEAAPIEPARQDSIIVGDFNTWAPTYTGARFNFIHCDFPYGVGMDKSDQGSAAAFGGYEDSADTYWQLLSTLAGNLDRIATESCHLLFWFSMKYYQPTLDFLTRKTDFVVEPFPLIWWKTDNVGILPDAQRGPRRVYETAFLARRGDRKVVQAVANAYGAPSVRERHMSEKPVPMLRHFFRMFIDENSLVLDPTAGSGSAIRAAEASGARYCLGLEVNPEFARIANEDLVKDRRLRNVK